MSKRAAQILKMKMFINSDIHTGWTEGTTQIRYIYSILKQNWLMKQKEMFHLPGKEQF